MRIVCFSLGLRKWLKIATGGKTSVPQIFFNKVYVGGNRELQDILKSPDQIKWNSLLKEVYISNKLAELYTIFFQLFSINVFTLYVVKCLIADKPRSKKIALLRTRTMRHHPFLILPKPLIIHLKIHFLTYLANKMKC